STSAKSIEATLPRTATRWWFEPGRGVDISDSFGDSMSILGTLVPMLERTSSGHAGSDASCHKDQDRVGTVRPSLIFFGPISAPMRLGHEEPTAALDRSR